MNHGFTVYYANIRPSVIGHRKFAVNIPLACGSGYIDRKLPLTSDLGSYIRAIHL